MSLTRAFGTGAMSATLGLASAIILGTAAQAQETLRFATGMQDNAELMVEVYGPLIEEINAAAEGEFTIQTAPPPFATIDTVWDRVTAGVADMGIILTSATGVPFPKTAVSTVPLLGGDVSASSQALWELYEQDMLDESFDAVKVLAMQVAAPNLILSKDEVTTLEDMQGVRIRAVDRNQADAMTSLGASPSVIPFSEAYQALDRGVIDAALANGNTVVSVRLGELAGNLLTNVHFGMTPLAIIMNQSRYDGLSDEAKAIIDENFGLQATLLLGQGTEDLEASYLARLEDRDDFAMNALSDEEVARWQEAISADVDAWSERTEGGAALLEAYQAAYDAAMESQAAATE